MKGKTKWRSSRVVFVLVNVSVLCLYSFVLFVASATSGMEVFDALEGTYAAVGPFFFFLVAAVGSSLRLRPRIERWVALTVFVLSMPAILYSFMYLGFLIIPLSAYWIILTFGDQDGGWNRAEAES